MKPIWWVVIISSIVTFILGLVMLVTRVFSEPPRTWWWTGGFAIALLIIGLLVGGIILYFKLKKKKPAKVVVAEDDAEARAKILLKYDNDNPDNFVRKDRVIKMVGEAGKDRTPILWLTGEGSETKHKIDIIVRLDDPERSKYPLLLFDKTDEKVMKTIVEYAENPEKVEVEERVLGRDEFGLPTTVLRTRRMSRAEKEEKEKEEKAEESQAY